MSTSGNTRSAWMTGESQTASRAIEAQESKTEVCIAESANSYATDSYFSSFNVVN